MKHKLIITESQYQALLDNITEQTKRDNFDIRLTKTKRAIPGWLQRIIGNKEDGYETPVPNSDDVAALDAILEGQDPNTYLNDKKVRAKVKSITTFGGQYFDPIARFNPKFIAAIIKLCVDAEFVYTSLQIRKDTEKSKTPPTKPTPGLPTVDSGEDSFPLDGTGKQYFPDNEWVVNDNFKKDFKEQVLDKLIEKKNQGVIENLLTLNIDTSCSRLRNGIPQFSPGFEKWKRINKRITFPELSTERNNAAKDYVLQQLKNIGINTDKVKISQNIKGENLDGTSGPDYTGTNRVSYDKYKFLKINMKFDKKINYDSRVDPVKVNPTPGQTITDNVYTAVLKSPDVPYRIPGIKFVSVWNPKTNTEQKCKAGPNNQLKCSQLDGPDDWSTDKKSDLYWGQKPN